MEDFANILERDYGLKPQGKSAPMSATKSNLPSSSSAPINRSSSSGKPKNGNGSNRSSRSSTPILGENLPDDLFFGGNGMMKSSSGRNTFGSGMGDVLGGGSSAYDDVFGGPPKFAPPAYASQSPSMENYDDIFRMHVKTSSSTKGSTLPVFDAPLYDDDIFGGVPGIRSGGVVYDDVFSGGSAAGPSPAVFEDLLGGFGAAADSRETTTSAQSSTAVDSGAPSAGDSAFDELLPGFGGAEPAKPRSAGDGKPSQRKSSVSVNDSVGQVADDPFVGLVPDRAASSTPATSIPDLDPFNIASRPPGGNGRNDSSNGLAEGISGFEDISPAGPTAPVAPAKSVSTARESRQRNATGSPTPSPTRSNAVRESSDDTSLRRNYLSNNHVKDQMKTSSSTAKAELGGSASSAEGAATDSSSRRSQQVPRETVVSPQHHKAEDPILLPKAEKSRHVDELWISIEDVKLVTQPTAAPPPSRPPPAPGSKPVFTSRKPADPKTEASQGSGANVNEFPAHYQAPAASTWQPSGPASEPSGKGNVNSSASVFDELEEFASGGSRVRKEARRDVASPMSDEDEAEGSAAAAASAAAMKEAMERTEAKLKLAKEARDREREERERQARAAKVREEREKAREVREAREREEKERARETEEKEKEREVKAAREAREREERDMEEREREAREKRRKEREKEEREREREREKDRIAVERATQEARERAAVEARERAAVGRATGEARERAAAEARERAAERAAVDRAAAEARARAERAAVERAAAEARARANAEARERAAERAAVERANAEARERAAERAAVERANAEARERAAERAAVERANAEARERAAERAAAERAAAEARERSERAAAAAREQQRRNDNDLESFFMSGSRPTSVPRQRPAATDSFSDGRQVGKGFSSEGQRRSSTGAAGVRKVASSTNIADDWTSLFSSPAPGEFQEVEGESAERRRARWERHHRTLERAAKALDEKNQRDMQSQREQAEKQRASETLDAEIKRWAAGKEGNLRALLSTLQYVLWPECGWQAVSLTDVITGPAVKKVYRKATLCVHPDKVQQKGATIQQKYIAEKVFDLLKEAWNKFNSEELF